MIFAAFVGDPIWHRTAKFHHIIFSGLKVIRIFRKQSKIQSAPAATNLIWRALEVSKAEVVLCNVANGCLAKADLFSNFTRTLTWTWLALESKSAALLARRFLHCGLTLVVHYQLYASLLSLSLWFVRKCFPQTSISIPSLDMWQW